MKIFHTSDWHIGRSFYTHSTLDALKTVLAALVQEVRERRIDVVIVAGDVFDSAMPSAEAFTVLSGALRDILNAGSKIVMTSGNHDSATRLGFQSEWAGLAGIHIITGHDGYVPPVTIEDEFGPVRFYGIPYLEPSLVRHHYPDVELRTHEQVLNHAMDIVREDSAVHGGRSVAISHCFVADVTAESTDVERDITAGGINLVSASVFDGPDYVALGHIHGRSAVSERVRYSGAPLHYSFGEAGKLRGGWIVELDVSGLSSVEWLDLPVPRALSVITGDLAALLDDPAYDGVGDNWVSAILTDQVRPMDAMRRLQARFPNAVKLEHRPTLVAGTDDSTYADRVRAKSEPEIIAGFLEHVRNGVGPSGPELALLRDVTQQLTNAEASA